LFEGVCFGTEMARCVHDAWRGTEGSTFHAIEVRILLRILEPAVGLEPTTC
jgi:hypothetical protein